MFAHVAVARELPSKTDFGDVDFFVAGPLVGSSHLSAECGRSTLDYETTVEAIKTAFGTPHGFRGRVNSDVMFFAVRAPGRSGDFFIQIDVKVCDRVDLFSWQLFQLNYASSSKIFGSYIKPLGLTTNPEGLFIRVEELEAEDNPGSMVFLTNDPEDVLKIVGLDNTLWRGGFGCDEERK